MSILSSLPRAEQQKIAAWCACRPIFNQPREFARVDDYGYVIRWADYGTKGDYGWEIDHRQPSALGGSDGLHNLRALHWRKNRELGGLLGNALNIFAQELPPVRRGGIFGQGRR